MRFVILLLAVCCAGFSLPSRADEAYFKDKTLVAERGFALRVGISSVSVYVYQSPAGVVLASAPPQLGTQDFCWLLIGQMGLEAIEHEVKVGDRLDVLEAHDYSAFWTAGNPAGYWSVDNHLYLRGPLPGYISSLQCTSRYFHYTERPTPQMSEERVASILKGAFAIAPKAP
jgi:hypothetical protein